MRNQNARDLLNDLNRHFIGFEELFQNIAHFEKSKLSNNFPPYSIRREGDNTYSIELAIAGFGIDDVDVQLEGDQLSIKGKIKDDKDENYLFRGIANRSFHRSFTLDENIVVSGAVMENGILKVLLERIIPEHKKPRKINIQSGTDYRKNITLNTFNPQLLTEEQKENLGNIS